MAESYPICSMPNCNRLVQARNLCGTHYARWWRHGDPSKGRKLKPKPISPCAVEGCSKPSVNPIGFCSGHYQRFLKYGNPTDGRVEEGVPLAWLKEVAIKYDGDECLLWPFGKNQYGYGMVHIAGDGKKVVSRLVCESVNGEPPNSNYDAAHSCGNGSLGCCTPMHLSWKTRADNEADKIVHGTLPWGERHGMAKLTASDVTKIRELRGISLQRDLAAKFGVCRKTISNIQNRRVWKRLA